jgi:hypothetical protein
MARKMTRGPQKAPKPPKVSAAASVSLLVASSLLYLLLAVRAARLETPTVDEFAHMPAGCAYWKHGAFDLYSKNPPLVKLWISLPVIAERGVAVPRPTGVRGSWAPWEYGSAFMAANAPRYLSMFFRARLMIIVLGLLTAGLLFLWARKIGSLFTAAVIASMFLLSPTVLAHAHLATTDIASAFTFLLSVMTLRWASLRSGPRSMAVAGASLGIALAAKFSAVLLLPIAFFLLLIAHHQRGRPMRWLGRSGLATDLCVLLLIALVTVNLLMGFAGALRPLGAYEFESNFAKGVQHSLPRWLPIPLPAAYISGFDAQKLDTETGEFGNYLLGRWSRAGWSYYYLFALLVKEPEVFVLLLLAAVWFLRSRRWPPGEKCFVVVPGLGVLFILSFMNKLNIGIRYLLPAYPFLFLLIVPVLEAIWDRRRKWLRYSGLAVLVGYYGVTAVAANPAYLSYFNPISGGRGNNPPLLLDSNLDWGQDLYQVPKLAGRLAEGEHLGLLYFGHVDPGLYGIHYDLVPPTPTRGLLAVSVNFLMGYPYVTPDSDGRLVAIGPSHLTWLRASKPVEKLGSIWVFDTRGR